MADIAVTQGLERIIPGSEQVVYDKVFIKTLYFTTHFNEKLTIDVTFGFYRIKEDNTKEEAPISLGVPTMTVDNVIPTLESIEGGIQLREDVTTAIINIAKSQGLI